MGKLIVENLRGETIEVTMWPDQLDQYRNALKKDDVPIRGIFTVSDFAGERGLVATNSIEIKEIL